MRSYVCGAMYTAGVQLVGATLHLKWLTGLGIWLAGVGMLGLISIVVLGSKS